MKDDEVPIMLKEETPDWESEKQLRIKDGLIYNERRNGLNGILSELRSGHAPTISWSSSVQSLFIATIALSFDKLLRAIGSFLSPQPLMLSTAYLISE